MNHLNVLYVDDEPLLLELGKEYLERNPDVIVTTMTSAIQALDALDCNPYDALVADYQMPIMDGIGLLKAIRDQGSDIPFIIFTGRGREEVVIEALNNGADFYLQKGDDPLSQFTELLHKIRLSVEMRRSREELQRSEAEKAMVFDNMPTMLTFLSTDLTIRYANRMVAEMLDLPMEEILGRKCFELWYGRDHPCQDCPVIRSGTSGCIEAGEMVTSEGKVLHITGTPLYDASKAIVGLIEFGADITDKKVAEKGIEAAHKKLKLLTRITRHDIKNQLVGIRGYMELVSDLTQDQHCKEYLERTDRLMGRIWNELEFVKEYESLGERDAEWHSLRSLLYNQVITGLTLRNDLTDVEILADPLIERAVYNLIDNAVKYAEGGTELHVYCVENCSDLKVVFQDNGVGIPDDEKEDIFQLGHGKNSGLGLHLIREILWATGITIIENGVYGEGARFELTIPAGRFRSSTHP